MKRNGGSHVEKLRNLKLRVLQVQRGLGSEIWKISWLMMVDDPSFQIDIPIFSKFIVQHVLLFGIPCLTHLLLMSLDYLLVSTWLALLTIVSLHVSSSTKKNHHTSLMKQQCFSTCNPKTKRGGLKHFLCCITVPPACDSSTVELGTFVPFGDAGRECKMHGSGQSIVIIM